MVTTERKKIDFLKARPEFFRADCKPAIVHLEPVQYLTLEGGGVSTRHDGPGSEFRTSVDTLYGVAYAVKRHAQLHGHDFRMPALQATWLPYHGFGDTARDLFHIEPSQWRWKLLIMVPDEIDEDTLAVARAEKYDGTPDSEVERVRLETVDEGLCVQALHVGPYAEQHHTIRAVRDFMERAHLRACGLHDEIYLTDPNRTPADKLRVILRQPVRSIEDEAPCLEDEW